VQEFVADAKKRPGAITYGSSGNYGTMHVPMEMLAASADIKLLHVPYTGGGPAVVALLRRQRRCAVDGPSTVIQHVKAARCACWRRGATSAWRAARCADADRSGIQHDVLPVGRAVRPAGTPEPVLRNLRTPRAPPPPIRDSSSAMATVETPIQYLDAPELARFWAADAQKLGEAVQARRQ
jgi:tripartite-type tricarboxylate transporter receptor subunit TctC